MKKLFAAVLALCLLTGCAASHAKKAPITITESAATRAEATSSAASSEVADTEQAQLDLTAMLSDLMAHVAHFTRLLAIDYTAIPVAQLPTTQKDGVTYAQVDFSTWEHVNVDWRSYEEMKREVESTFISFEESGPIQSLAAVFTDIDGKLYFNTTLCTAGGVNPKWLPETATITEQTDDKIVLAMSVTIIDKTKTATLELVKNEAGKWVFNHTYWD